MNFKISFCTDYDYSLYYACDKVVHITGDRTSDK